MLRDLLKGKPRDITPKNRPTCFDSLGGGGSGDNIFVVTFTCDYLTSADTYSCDKTFEEIDRAVAEGKIIHCRHKYNSATKFTSEFSMRFNGIIFDETDRVARFALGDKTLSFWEYGSFSIN